MPFIDEYILEIMSSIVDLEREFELNRKNFRYSSMPIHKLIKTFLEAFLGALSLSRRAQIQLSRRINSNLVNSSDR